MDWRKILSGLVVGAILGIAGLFYAFNGRLARLEEKIGHLESKIKSNITPTYTDIEEIFNEPFNTNQLGWGEDFENEITKWYFDKGKYIIENNSDVAIYSHPVKLPSLPTNYYIELKSIWESETQEGFFGLHVGFDDKNQYSFTLTKSGYATVWLSKNGGEYKEIIPKKGGFFSKTYGAIIQKIERRGDNFIYYINGEFVGQQFADEFDWKEIRLSVGDKQIVKFDNLKIVKQKKIENKDR